MPTYVYECAKCGDEFEVWQSFSEESLKKHPECGGKLAKVIQPAGIVLKGSGFYKNDSRGTTPKRKKSERDSEKATESTSSGADKSSDKGSNATTESKATDSKKSTDSKNGSDSGSKRPSEASASSTKP